MTAAPLEWPPEWHRRPLTVADYLALGETDVRVELVEGKVVMAPSPSPAHMEATFELGVALRGAVPSGFRVVPEIDLDLQLAPAELPGFVRSPDLAVVRSTALRRVKEQGGVIRAADTLLVVEVISPSSKRTDRVDKRGEYAEAGIPYYWILDLTEPVSLLVCHQTGEFRYADSGEFTGKVSLVDPFPFELNLANLVF
ncbi:Uma2 family endonuclease [Pseudonocardia spinosispora]|uniref:Uma2 family endonuclease n=1 Tax=Pseudonocardia spinosispora TaxID=103441 RepID=UPI00049004A1|nr:Uma2 family endonuclease [Pseudonocardia spinosispora]